MREKLRKFFLLQYCAFNVLESAFQCHTKIKIKEKQKKRKIVRKKLLFIYVFNCMKKKSFPLIQLAIFFLVKRREN